MPIVDNKTPNRLYPEPEGTNDLVDDVARIVMSLRSIDTDVAGLLASLAAKAPLVSPSLSGLPTAPTGVLGLNTQQLATTAFVQAAISALIDASPGALDTLGELAAALGDDPSFATTITNLLATKAPFESPTFTGVPAAPTPPDQTNTTQLSTTAFVQSLMNSRLFPGDIVTNFDITPRSGFLEMDGSTVVGGEVTYPIVSARYPWMVSAGNLMLPDGRGRSLRIWDHGAGVDPDAASRAARSGDGQTGDYPATLQEDAIPTHTHIYQKPLATTQGLAVGTGNSINAGALASVNSGLPNGANSSSESRSKNIGISIFMLMG